MQPGQAAIRLRVDSEVTLEDAEAHSGLIVGLVCILLGVLVPGLGGVGVVVSAPSPPALALCDDCLKFGPAAGRVQVALERKSRLASTMKRQHHAG